MFSKEQPLGFVAFWKATDTWFKENEEQQKDFIEKIKQIFAQAREKGVKMYGVYDCSWSSEWRYFTFWECPTLEILEETVNQLAEIGDINMYNHQRHFVGRRLAEEMVQ